MPLEIVVELGMTEFTVAKSGVTVFRKKTSCQKHDVNRNKVFRAPIIHHAKAESR